jgi:hypothetical protein
VSATVLDSCLPSTMTLDGSAYAVKSTPYTAWTVVAAAESGATAVGATAATRNQTARNTLCRVSVQQSAVPAIHQAGIVVTVNY